MTTALIEKKIRNYKILRHLGDGGMGSVYLARLVRAGKGLPAGTQVALKILHPHLVGMFDVLRRFKREAGLGLAIRHPRVVATHDVGEEKVGGSTYHFLVMEYLPGETLRQRLDRDVRLPEATVVELGRQLLEGLAEIHQHGAIHRDLKPSNIFIHDDQVKIADLGLSRLLDPQTEISLPGTVLGSVAYAAPEQMSGNGATPASDIYSLGVILYEMASGRNPFLRDDFKATVRAHAETPPPALGSLVASSYFLERVIGAMLAKDPQARLMPAARLVQILAEREHSEFWREFVAGEEPVACLSPARRRLRIRRATRMQGRTDAVERLVDVIRTAGVGRTGGMAVVTGEPGIGRTRLVDAALDLAEQEGIPTRVVVSRFLDQATPVPFFALNAILLEALDLHTLGREEREAALPALLRSHLPERGVFADAFAALIVGGGAEASSKLPPRAVPALYAEALRTLSARRALCIVIEELQWADRGSIRVLEGLFPSFAAYPLAVIGTLRDVDLDVDPPARGDEAAARARPAVGLLQQLIGQDGVQRLPLDRLDREAVAAVLRDLAVPADRVDALAALLHRVSEGNPAFLFALIDDLDQGEHRLDALPEELEQLPLPSSIRELLDRRLQALDPEARRFVEFASVFGTRFKLEDVVAGLALDPQRADEIVERLRHRHRLLRPADDAYRFDYHLIKDSLYHAIPPAQRREDNRTVARVLKRKVVDPHVPSQHTYEAAIHFSQGGDHAEAARHLVGAVRYLAGRSLHNRAERLAKQALVHAEQAVDLAAADRFAVYECLAAVAGHLGHRDVQGDALRKAARIAYDAGDARKMAEAEVLLARHAGATGRVFSALDHVARARSQAQTGGFLDLQAAAIRVEATVLWLKGEVDLVTGLCEAETLATAAGDEVGRAFGLLQLGRLYLTLDRLSLALATLKRALKIFEVVGDQRGRGRVLFQIARVYREIGDLRRAGRALELADRIADGNQDRGLQARCRYLRGDLAMRGRDASGAERHLHSALRDLTAAADPTFQVYTLSALSLLYTSSRFTGRDPRRAIALARRAVRIARELQVARLSAYAYAVLAVAYLTDGNRRFALAVSRKGVRYLEQEDPGRKRASELLFVHYRCLKAVGRNSEARGMLTRARDLVLQRASEIEKDGMRRSFLENDRFNSEVLREANRVLG